MSIASIITLIIVALEVSLLSVIFLGSKTLSSRAFSFAVLTHVFWMFSHMFFHASFTDSTFFLSLVKLFGITSAQEFASINVAFSYFSGIVTSAAFFYFTRTFPDDTKPPIYIPAAIATLILSTAPLYMSGLIVGDAQYVGGQQRWLWHFGELWFLFDIFFLFFWGAGIYTLYTKARAATATRRANLFSMLWGFLVAIIPASLVNVILPRLGVFTFDWLGPVASVIWIGIITFSVIRFKQMNVRTVFSQILILSAILILFFNIFSAGIVNNFGSALEAIVKTGVFVSFIFVGRKLVTNIFNETKRKKQVESLNNQLATLHNDLEGQVVIRTQELAEAKLHSETILENLTLGVIEYDENFTVLRVNRAAEQFLGIERRGILGNNIQPKDKKEVRLSSLATVLYPALAAEGKKISSKEEFEGDILKNEMIITYPKKRELQVTTITLKGLYASERPRYVKLLRDVTKENLVDRSKSEFIKIAAHQLRTPLSGTKWALRATLDGDLGEISPTQKALLQKTYDTNKSLIDIVNDLLNVTRIEEDFGYHKKISNIIDVIKESILSSMLLAKDKKLNIAFKKTAADVPLFAFDKIKILLALKNVVANAIDYTPDGGDVTITLKTDSGYAVVTVTDTGIGISQDSIDRIFTRFYRAPEAISLSPTRTGLGLYITKDIVEKHGGNIMIESKPGVGTSTTVRLPLDAKETGAPTASLKANLLG
jgi:PAS domain S-box-containing protein